ncbi:MAG: DNA adenine methylase [Bacteroidia bacterium]|nr:DNA adenine methylase [Bacteroidia bacterium]
MEKTEKQAKPFVKWVGGKGQLLSQIDSALPKRLFMGKEVTYIEPFVGGGAMLFYMLEKFQNIKKAVINDINKDLIIAYKTVRDNPNKLINRLKEIELEYLALNEEKRKEYFLEKRDLYNTKQLPEIENASLFIFLNRTCFNGLYRVNSKGLFNVPFGKYANPKICDEPTILKDSKLLQKVEILNSDFENTINYIDGNTFFYFDPPYRPLNFTSSFNSYSKESFNDDEQIRLKRFCDKITQKECFLMLSNSDCKSVNPLNVFFDDLYSKYKIERVWASRSVNANSEKRGKLTELLISNFNNNKLIDLDYSFVAENQIYKYANI